MARTSEGATLTERHRQAQLRIRALAVRDYLKLWPLWDLSRADSYASLVTATLPLLQTYHRMSSAAAAEYYAQFRAAEGAMGAATPRVAEALPVKQATTSLYVTGYVMTRDALLAGQPVEQARQTALVRTSGALARMIFDGGRSTLLRSVQADKVALGWARVTDANPCAFCALLASRGPVYKTEASADFRAHDHCACTVEPFYEGSDWPGQAREYKAMYTQAIRDARADGSLERGTSNDLLNAFRRYYAGR